MRAIHIVAALLALVAGFLALYAAKGGTLHRKAGLVFAYAMMTMTGSAVIMAAFLRPNRGNVVAGLLTFTLVATSLITVRRTVAQSRHWVIGFKLVSVATGLYALGLGNLALHSPKGVIDHIPAAPILFFGVVALLAALGDARLLHAGVIEGRKRIARHLWRMTFALWVATASGFLGQAKFIPAPYRDFRLLAIPVLLVALTLVYWLVRTLWWRRSPVRTRSAGRGVTLGQA
jgi:hypothetical protein